MCGGTSSINILSCSYIFFLLASIVYLFKKKERKRKKKKQAKLFIEHVSLFIMFIGNKCLKNENNVHF